MADWRSTVSASERYDNIETISNLLGSNGIAGSNAFAIENHAYSTALSREEYYQLTKLPFGDRDEQPVAEASIVEGPAADLTGTRIGQYKDCIFIAEGLTSEVYRSSTYALKVIVETRNIEPHNPQREVKILQQLVRPGIIPLLDTFRDQEQRLVLVFPFMPLTLTGILESHPEPLSPSQIRLIFTDVLDALRAIHAQGVIHRDLKPSAILLAAPTGPAYLSDFGTAWHPSFSNLTEPASEKILDIGTGPYRSPEALFGDRSYGPEVDMWAIGTVIAECLRSGEGGQRRSLFESRAAHEDGNQLGLILSIFKTLGTPTRETWPEAERLKTKPFDMYRMLEARPWEDLLPDVAQNWRDLVKGLIKYGGRRLTAEAALGSPCLVAAAQMD